MSKPNILVLCTGNSARSQMAEAFLRKHAGDRFNVYSAGTQPKGMNLYTVRAMAEAGLDVSQQRSKSVTEFLGTYHLAYLIVVCHEAEANCPRVWPGVAKRLFWPFADPAAQTGTDEEKLAAFRAVRDQIEAKVLDWLKALPAA